MAGHQEYLGRTCLVHPVIPHFSTTPSTRHKLTCALRNRDLSRPHYSHHASCRSDLSLGGRCAVHYCIWQGEAAGHCESPPRSRLRTPSTSLWVKCFADKFCCFPFDRLCTHPRQLGSHCGGAAISQLWFVYTLLFHRPTLRSQRALRREILATKQELAATSSQDQFAKWAKLRRRVDKGLADLERTNSELARARTTFSMLFKGIMFVITTILPFCVTSWYSKTPIFWLPPAQHSWFGPLGWFLALPRAPKGAISSTVWQMVCTRTLIALGGALANFWPTNKVEVLDQPKVDPIIDEKIPHKPHASASKASPPPAEQAPGARKRTNANPASVSEKQDL